MARRSYGSGSKREVRPGVWQLRAGGRSSTFVGTGKEAERELARLVAVGDGPRRPASVPTLAELLAQWQSTARLESSTQTTYGHVLAHLPVKFGAQRIDRLTLRDFDRLYADLERQGVGAPTIRKLHTILSAALTRAVRWQMIAAHPARGAQLPRVVTKPKRLLSPDQLSAVLTEAQRSLDGEAFVRLAIATGGRRGELIALRWDDVDLDAGTITISRALRADRSAKPGGGRVGICSASRHADVLCDRRVGLTARSSEGVGDRRAARCKRIDDLRRGGTERIDDLYHHRPP